MSSSATLDESPSLGTDKRDNTKVTNSELSITMMKCQQENDKRNTKSRVFFVPGVVGWDSHEADCFSILSLLNFNYFSGYKYLPPEYKVEIVSGGSLHSVHDSAVTLFYKIKGGQTDYGEEHSKTFGHARYGKKYWGLHRGWSAEQPIHLVGHSFGGVVSNHLLHLLDSDFFGCKSDASWVLSITTVNSPHNGFPLNHMFGYDMEGNLQPFSFLHLWSVFVLALTIICTFIPFRWIYNFQLGIWQDAFKKSCLLSDTHPVVFSKDVCGSDLTLKQSLIRNQSYKTFSNVYYFTIVSSHTKPSRPPPSPASFRRGKRENEAFQEEKRTWRRELILLQKEEDDHHVPSWSMNPVFYIISFFTGRLPANLTLGSSSPMRAWRENDGVIPIASQMPPLWPYQDIPLVELSVDYERPAEIQKLSNGHLIHPGIWHVICLEENDHTCLSTCHKWWEAKKQGEFYTSWIKMLKEL